MTLSPPTSAVWWISFILTVLAIFLHLGVITIAGLMGFVFWMVVIAAVLLLIATRVHNF
jgi:hypothetical protein